MELKSLIIKYYNSDDKSEKYELRNELLKKKTELNLPPAFEVLVLTHYEAFNATGKKAYLEEMLELIS